ncbi:MAG: His/Gly/Thr/Pro-type tRNA ligase C-terminal domain-containing protein, partial [Bacillota bacterium]
FETLENQTVTIRDRDTMQQERLHVDELRNYIAAKIAF